MIRKLLLFLLKLLVVVVFLLAIIWVAFNWPVKGKNETMNFHLSFSQLYANSLGLDWKKAYEESLADLKPEKIRVAAYWTEIEKERGLYDWDDLDWMLKKAKENNVKVTLAFGIKVPRWPECFIPDFYLENKKEREEALLAYEKVLLDRYKDDLNIIVWQVENEPFLSFGSCIEGAIDGELIDREIALVKEIDQTRPVMVTDSGELSIWVEAAKRADIFGTTLYRIIHKEPFGYVHYPLGPAFFRLKALLIKQVADQDRVVVSEMQAEPWAPGWVLDNSIEEQYKSMNPDKLREIVDYTQRTNFEETYLWGVEWWYWLKEKQNKPEMWNEVKSLIEKQNSAN